MKVIVATEARLFVDSDGRFMAPTQGRAYRFWTRYLEEFESVGVLARVSRVPLESGHLVEGPGVSVLPITDFAGLKGTVCGGVKARAEVTRLADDHPGAALIARLPGVVGGLLTARAARTKRPYAIEVVGDPHSAVLTAGLAGQASRVMALLARTNLRRRVREAGAVAYVTREMLQATYPPAAGATVASYSSVELSTEAFREPDAVSAVHSPPHLIMVGTMSQTYKGHDVLLDAMSILAVEGLKTRVTFIGDGRLRGELEQTAKARSLDVTFTGQLGSANEVRDALDTADLFVMPSRSEGLPRALIEAMARSLPAIGSAVGGIPELLETESLVPPDDARALAAAIRIHLLEEKRRELIVRNHRVAREYHQSKLTIERRTFYSAVRAQVERHSQSTEER